MQVKSTAQLPWDAPVYALQVPGCPRHYQAQKRSTYYVVDFLPKLESQSLAIALQKQSAVNWTGGL